MGIAQNSAYGTGTGSSNDAALEALAQQLDGCGYSAASAEVRSYKGGAVPGSVGWGGGGAGAFFSAPIAYGALNYGLQAGYGFGPQMPNGASAVSSPAYAQGFTDGARDARSSLPISARVNALNAANALSASDAQYLAGYMAGYNAAGSALAASRASYNSFPGAYNAYNYNNYNGYNAPAPGTASPGTSGSFLGKSVGGGGAGAYGGQRMGATALGGRTQADPSSADYQQGYSDGLSSNCRFGLVAAPAPGKSFNYNAGFAAGCNAANNNALYHPLPHVTQMASNRPQLPSWFGGGGAGAGAWGNDPDYARGYNDGFENPQCKAGMPSTINLAFKSPAYLAGFRQGCAVAGSGVPAQLGAEVSSTGIALGRPPMRIAPGYNRPSWF